MSNHADSRAGSRALDARWRHEAAVAHGVSAEVQELLSIDPDIDLDAFAAEPVHDEVASVRVVIPERQQEALIRNPEPEAVAHSEESTPRRGPVTDAARAHGAHRHGAWVVLCGLAMLFGAGLVVAILARGTTEGGEGAPGTAAAAEPTSPAAVVPAVAPAPAPSAVEPRLASSVAAAPTAETEVQDQAPPRPAPGPGVVTAGWLHVDAPIDLDIELEGVVIGSSRSDRTMLEAGVHVLTFVNDRLGYRTTERVSITGGQMRSVQVSVPGGVVSVNAQPWASVTVDGTPIGDTPLGNVAVAAGDHEVVFSHPRLGERRVATLVRVGEHKRLNVDFSAPSR